MFIPEEATETIVSVSAPFTALSKSFLSMIRPTRHPSPFPDGPAMVLGLFRPPELFQDVRSRDAPPCSQMLLK